MLSSVYSAIESSYSSTETQRTQIVRARSGTDFLLCGLVCLQASSISAHLHVNPLIMPPKPAPVVAAPSSAVQTLWKAYNEQTSDRLKFIDSFLVFLMLSGIVQFAYCVLVTTFPYNAFLSGYEASAALIFDAHLPLDSRALLASSS